MVLAFWGIWQKLIDLAFKNQIASEYEEQYCYCTNQKQIDCLLNRIKFWSVKAVNAVNLIITSYLFKSGVNYIFSIWIKVVCIPI